MNSLIPSIQLVELIDGQPMASSLDVAARFRKRHDTVLRAIRHLECSAEFTLHNFAECHRAGANGKPEPFFRMTRDGFSFLCMGFTGREAAKWKEAYISEFNEMEIQLQQPYMQDMQRYINAAATLAAEVQKVALQALMREDTISYERFCVAFDGSGSDRVSVNRIHPDAALMPLDEVAHNIRTPGQMPVKESTLINLASACMAALERRQGTRIAHSR